MSGAGSRRGRPLIVLGTMTFGDRTPAADAERQMAEFLDRGFRCIDTAHIYTNGESERIIGRFLRGRDREGVHLATKVYPGGLGKTARGGLRPRIIRRKLETSLRRLRTDYVDLLYLHAPDNATPLEESLGACNELFEEGKIREIGLSNYPSWQVAEAVLVCMRNGWPRPAFYQGMYNALTRDVERECIPACRRFGVKFLAYNPLAGGLLTGKYAGARRAPRSGRFSRPYYRARYWNESYLRAACEARDMLQRHRTSLGEAAIRWLCHHGMADGLVLGASRFEHLLENLAACGRPPLPLRVRRALDAAWEIARPACPRYFRD